MKFLTQWKDTFWRFCVVGLSGVFVNLSCLALFHNLGMQGNLASAAAIEVSILSNFVINDRWTFQQQTQVNSWGQRALKFQMVSLVGGVIQWSCFVAMNFVWLYYGCAEESWTQFWHTHQGVKAYIHAPTLHYYLYISQLVGVGVATLWNFMLNFYWTWAYANPHDS